MAGTRERATAATIVHRSLTAQIEEWLADLTVLALEGKRPEPGNIHLVRLKARLLGYIEHADSTFELGEK